jgi:hypothetical protein
MIRFHPSIKFELIPDFLVEYRRHDQLDIRHPQMRIAGGHRSDRLRGDLARQPAAVVSGARPVAREGPPSPAGLRRWVAGSSRSMRRIATLAASRAAGRIPLARGWEA